MIEEAIINKYNNRTIETTQVIEEIVQMAKEMNAVNTAIILSLLRKIMRLQNLMGDLVLKQNAHE